MFKAMMNSVPGVKGDAVEEGSVVVVPHVVSDHRLAGAGLGHHLVLHRDVVLGIVDVHQQDAVDQGGMGRHLLAWMTPVPRTSTLFFIIDMTILLTI